MEYLESDLTRLCPSLKNMYENEKHLVFEKKKE